MATARAIANGNWSATSTWNGGVVPGNGDTVYSNGFNVTLDVSVTIGGANNPIVNTGSLVSGQWYEIVNVGGQAWTSIGATSNTAGLLFQATGAGTAGNQGTARALATLSTQTNTAAGATTGGGGFLMPSSVDCFASLRAGNTTCLSVTATTGTINGISSLFCFVGAPALSTSSGSVVINFVGSTIDARDTSVALSIASGVTFNITTATILGSAQRNINNSGTLNINAATTIPGGGGNYISINNGGTGTIVFNAACTVQGAGTTANQTSTIVNSGAIIVNQPCIFTAGSSNGCAINSINSGSLTMNVGCVMNASAGSQAAINHSSTGNLVAIGQFNASSTAPAITGSGGANHIIRGDFYSHWSGFQAVFFPRWRLGTAPANAQTRYALAGTTDSYFSMYTPDYATLGNPATTNVRSGTVYGPSNELTGTCAVPAAGSVALGVAVDNTTGTAVLTEASVRTAVGLASANLDAQFAAIPAAPSAAAIRAEIDANSTKLDATVSSRLASSSYSAPLDAAGTRSAVGLSTGNLDTQLSGISSGISGLPSASAIATAVWAAATRTLTTAIDNSATIAAAVWSYATGRTITGGTVDTLTNAPSVPSAATIASQVRTELSTELGRIDATVSSRLAPAGTLARVTLVDTTTTLSNAPDVPTEAEIADAVRTELAPELARVANAATTQEVGDIVEGALGD